ncbi:alpha/beta fold hydrolase [Tepidiforma sp.]|uniref:alpha/beta fold hydrolase n=1 Tax=Tepidiforma sp. TaxID=2682230 RepID=UPI002ADD9187|nr:alpha/beta fold hydrolase [Tepidiforma sp.]
MTVFLTHNRVKLALHTLRAAEGPALLLLHALGDRSPAEVPPDVAGWPGPVYALDFTGHGASSVPAGGGYTAEVLMGDADIALAALGRATLVGRGLGGYIALLLAGARPREVAGAAILDGAGLAGGGDRPGPAVVRGVPGAVSAPHPFALVELGSDIRPPDYVRRFAELAVEHSPLRDPIAVCGRMRPEWLRAVLDVPGVREEPLESALARFAAAARPD